MHHNQKMNANFMPIYPDLVKVVWIFCICMNISEPVSAKNEEDTDIHVSVKLVNGTYVLVLQPETQEIVHQKVILLITIMVNYTLLGL